MNRTHKISDTPVKVVTQEWFCAKIFVAYFCEKKEDILVLADFISAPGHPCDRTWAAAAAAAAAAASARAFSEAALAAAARSFAAWCDGDHIVGVMRMRVRVRVRGEIQNTK